MDKVYQKLIECTKLKKGAKVFLHPVKIQVYTATLKSKHQLPSL